MQKTPYLLFSFILICTRFLTINRGNIAIQVSIHIILHTITKSLKLKVEELNRLPLTVMPPPAVALTFDLLT